MEPWEFIKKADPLLEWFNDAVDFSEIKPAAIRDDDEDGE